MDFDFSILGEAKYDKMPRKKSHVEPAEELGFDMVDDLMKDTTEMTDPNSMEKVATPTGKRKMTKEQAAMYECGCDALNKDPMSQSAMVVDGSGNVMQVMTGDQQDYELDREWFVDANQEFMDRTGNGERWIEVVNDLARRFAEFFDGSYEAFDFAADAFGRRSWEMGVTESQLMVEEFDRTGRFAMPKTVPVFEAEYNGKTVSLNKPTRNTDGKSQMKVYVNSGKKTADGKIKAKKVTFGDPNSRIKKNQPGRRKNFRARHNCDNPGPKTKARYWSCKAW